MNLSLPQSFLANPNLHAYLFVSGSFSARRDMSRLLAKALLCENKEPDGHPCDNCSNCKKANSLSHPDIIYVSGETKTSVDDIRKIENEAYLAPNEASSKIFVLENADEYNTQSQNALLKIIEEPPSGVKFLLTASSSASLLPTVRSRVCTLSGSEKSRLEILRDIKKAKPSLSEDKALSLAVFLQFFDKTDIKSIDENAFFDYLENAYLFLSGKDKNAIFKLPKKREELMLGLQVYCLCLWQISRAKQVGQDGVCFLDSQKFREILSKLSIKRSVMLYDIFEEAYLQAAAFAGVNALLSYIWQSTK